MKEPVIIINGILLGEGASMTIRVAIEEFASALKNGLGKDPLGTSIYEGYLNQITEIRKVIYNGKISAKESGHNP